MWLLTKRCFFLQLKPSLPCFYLMGVVHPDIVLSMLLNFCKKRGSFYKIVVIQQKVNPSNYSKFNTRKTRAECKKGPMLVVDTPEQPH